MLRPACSGTDRRPAWRGQGTGRGPVRRLSGAQPLGAGAVAAGRATAAQSRDSSPASTPAATTSTTSTAGTKAQRARRAKKAKSRTYTVKAGDTLSGIAGKTDVSLERIQELNPKLDSQTLQTGETIKLGP